MNCFQIQYNVIVNDEGKLVIQGNESFKSALKQHIGRKGSLKINFYDERDAKSLIGHYKFHVLPRFKEAYYDLGEHLLDETIEERLWKLSAVTQDYEHCNIWKLQAHEVLFYIEDLKRIAAEKFSKYIT